MIQAVKIRVQARTETGGTGPDELLFVTRERQADNTYKLDYYGSSPKCVGNFVTFFQLEIYIRGFSEA